MLNDLTDDQKKTKVLSFQLHVWWKEKKNEFLKKAWWLKLSLVKREIAQWEMEDHKSSAFGTKKIEL